MIFDLLFQKGESRITNSRDLADYLGAGFASASGVSVTPESAMRYAAFFSCVRVLAESVGQLPLHLYRQSGDSRVKAKEHRLYGILHDAPNDYQTSQEFWEMCVAHLAMRGNFYAFKNMVRGEVRELLPLNPDSIQPKLREDYSLWYEVAFANGTRDVLSADQVFHVKLLTLDGFTGLSPLAYAREAIGLGIATQQHGSRLFSNGAKPGGVLSTDQVLGDEAYKRIKESWDAAHQGAENAHKVAILEAGLSWTQVGMSAEDSQFLETRKHQRSEVAGLMRVPLHKIGDLEHATFSNIEHQGLEFVTDALMPYLTRIEQRVKVSLLSPSERATHFAKFNVNGLLRGDMKARAEYYTKQIQNGALSPNEIRELEDMNPREGGDIYLTPLNMAINGRNPKEGSNED